MKQIYKRAAAAALCLCMIATQLPAALAAEPAPARGVLSYTQHIAPKYEDADLFSEDLAAVKQNGKWGYIDVTGATVVAPQYDLAYSFNEGLAIVGKLSTRTMTDYTGAPLTVQVYELGFINRTGSYTAFQMYDPLSDAETPPLVPYYSEADYYPTDTNLFFHNGVVSLPSDYPDGLYTTTGKPFASDLLPNGTMNEGLCPGHADAISACGYFNAQGKTVLYWAEEDAEYFGEALPDPWGGTSQSYRYISQCMPFNQGLAPVWQNTYDARTQNETSLLGFIDKTGAWIIPPQFDNFFYTGVNSTFQLFGETGLAMVAKDDKYGAIDKTGKTIIPFQYEELWPVSEGMIPFMQNGKYGYLNAGDYSVAIAAQYEAASGFHNGLAVVYNGTAAYIIDKTGTAVPGSDKLNPSSYFLEMPDGTKAIYQPSTYSVILENGKYGYGKIDYLPPLPKANEMSSWAYTEVSTAIEKNLVPTDLQNLYRNNITRQEFCDLALQAISQVTGKDITVIVKEKTGKDYYTWVQEYPFTDVSGGSVVAAYALGIVSGRGGGVFDPYATITRQEAAAFLMRSAKVLGMDTTKLTNAQFTDSDTVGVWFQDAVNFVSQIQVMSGTGGNQFSPLGTYTREQSYVTIYRLFQAIVK